MAGLLAAFFVAAGDQLATASAPPEADPRAVSTDPAELLRLAQSDRAAGQPARARQTLARVAREYPVVADYADLFALETLMEEANFEAAHALIEEAKQRHAGSVLLVQFLAKDGDALAELGDEAGARSAWLAVLQSKKQTRSEEATFWARVARSHEREGELGRARTTYLRLWLRFPGETVSDEEAANWLAADEESGGKKRSAGNWRKRGDELSRRRNFAPAVIAYDRALALGLSSTVRKRVRLSRAKALFGLRRYTEAEKAYAALPQHGRTAIERARALARAGDVDAAIERLLAFSRSGPSNRSMGLRASYIAALLLIGEDRQDEAKPLLEVLAKDPRSGSLRRVTLWLLGWDDYLEGRFAEAASQFEQLAKIESRDPIRALKPRYWQARALTHLGDPRGERELERIAAEFPLSYYGFRAAQRTKNSGRPPLDDIESEKGAAALDPLQLDRIRILLAANLTEAAATEIRRLLAQPLHPNDRLTLAALASAADEYNLAQISVMRGSTATLARGPQRHAEEFWWHAWPRAYAGEVAAAVNHEVGKVPPSLVFAIMREESGYQPGALSAVGARGLMQIMEPTGQELARDRGLEPIEAIDLFQPALNIQLGTQYLGDLSDRFPGQPAAAIASYNAGPHIVAKWSGLGELEEDEWVETIPYDQTQKYVKRVLRSRHAYGSLYGDD